MQAVNWSCRVTEPGGTVILIDIQDFTALYNEMGMTPFSGGPNIDLDRISQQWDAFAGTIRDQALSIVTASGRKGSWQVNTMQAGEGSAAAVFHKLAEEHGAELLIVGQHHGSTRIEGLFGSFPRWLVSHGHLPVLIVPVPLSAHLQANDQIGSDAELSPP
jgi:nucleotide-binding universal stress UspA family protein